MEVIKKCHSGQQAVLTNCHVFVKCSSLILVSGNDHANCNCIDRARYLIQAIALAILLHECLVNSENVESTVVFNRKKKKPQK